MNINIAIIDQRLIKISEQIRDQAREELGITDETRLKSLSFVFLTVRTVLDLTDEETFDCLTEGSGDFGVDAIHLSEECDQEIAVTLFQGKYMQNLEGNSNFPEDGISKLIRAIWALFDPSTPLDYLNPRLSTKVEEIRSLIRDGYIPRIRAIACNNGKIWNDIASQEIQRADLGDQAVFEHVNHDRLVAILQAAKPVHDTLQFTGKALVEDFNFSRVLVGRMAVYEIYSLIERHGERLLERNIRRYLGLSGNRVNEAIRDTLLSEERGNFYFYNNGITLTCDKFLHNAFQSGDFPVKVENLQIINGGQTCMTIYKTLRQTSQTTIPQDAFVLVRLYQLPSENEDLVRQITYATNSQNPVDLRDLKANDTIQRQLEMDIQELGFTYRRKRTDSPLKPTDISSGTAAQAILAVWRKKPHQAKYFIREHFGRLYVQIFKNNINGAQTIIAALIYRIPEAKRRKLTDQDPQFLRYASAFIAMQMGKYLLRDMGCPVHSLNHQNFSRAKQLLDDKGSEYLERSIESIDAALKMLYGTGDISLQQLAATFRRGDLIEILDRIEE